LKVIAEWKKHRPMGIFRQTAVLPVFRDTHHLHASSIRHFEIAVDCIFSGAEDFSCKFAIHDCAARRILIIVPSEIPATEQRGAFGAKVIGRNVEHVDIGGGICGPQIGRLIAEDIG
jgi:hypothetical protein